MTCCDTSNWQDVPEAPRVPPLDTDYEYWEEPGWDLNMCLATGGRHEWAGYEGIHILSKSTPANEWPHDEDWITSQGCRNCNTGSIIGVADALRRLSWFEHNLGRAVAADDGSFYLVEKH